MLATAPTIAHGVGAVPAARSFIGSYSVTVTDKKRGNFSGCLTVGENAAATLTIGTASFSGTYLVLGGAFAATITALDGNQNVGMMFMSSARGKLTSGIFEEVDDGIDFSSGSLVFGPKNSC